MIRLLPRSTLFPTRRSSDLTSGVWFKDLWFKQLTSVGLGILALSFVLAVDYRRLYNYIPHFYVIGLLMLVAVLLFGQDRKSTRLNSSHVEISYAVFCLKKKN